MMGFRCEEFTVGTPEQGFVNVTERVQERVSVRKGFCLVFCPHTTAAVTVNEDEEGLREDVEEKLDELIPPQDDYAHNEGHSPNAHAHMKAMLLGSSHTLPVREGELQLGTYQQVLLMENDGPQERTVQVWCLGE